MGPWSVKKLAATRPTFSNPPAGTSMELKPISRVAPVAAFWVLLCCLLTAVAAKGGTYVIEERTLSVLSPSSIEGMYDIAISTFGRPKYAGSVLGALHVPKQGGSACTNFDRFGVSFKGMDSDYRHAPIALIESTGECDFAWKVLNAQNAGAVAVIIVDHLDQSLQAFTDEPFASTPHLASYMENLTIPSALVNKTLGDLFKSELQTGTGAVNVKLEWTEAPKEPVKYEIWTISQDKCGAQCDKQVQFVEDFRGVAQNLEKGGYTVFTPHYIVWYCPPKYVGSKDCQSQCIHNGRYCSPDPEDDFSSGYEGKDVVIENLRQLCVHKLFAEKQRPWMWWDFVADCQIRCSMKEGKYTRDCGNEVAASLGLNASRIVDCMGDPFEDKESELLSAEQVEQQGKGGDRGDITFAPTLVIENKKYAGKLDNHAVLRSLCKLFVEGEEPPLCLGGAMETNECLVNNGGCWSHPNGLVSACKDTYKGRVCECPFYQGVQLEGDGYTNCEPVGRGRCRIDNAGCWQETRGNLSFSACSDAEFKGCKCPDGFKDAGEGKCVNVDECAEKTRCHCPECSCQDTWGSYDCSCSGDLIYLRQNDVCVRKIGDAPAKVFFISFGSLALAAVAIFVLGILVYKYKVRQYMDSRIRTTLAQYMPLDSNNQDIYRHLQDDDG